MPTSFATITQLQTLIDQKNYSSAIKLGEQLRTKKPKSPPILFYTALAYQYNNQPENAKKLYLTAINSKATMPEVYNNLAMIYVKEEKFTQAATILTAAINSDKAIATAYANLTQIYRHLASQAYKQVLDNDEVYPKENSQLNPLIISTTSYRPSSVPSDINNDSIKEPIQVATASTKKVIPVEAESRPIKKPIVGPVQRTVSVPKTDIEIINKSNNNYHQISSQEPTEDLAKQIIFNWKNAWENKDLQLYLDSYVTNYSPSDSTHQIWLANRTRNLTKKGKIKVDIDAFDVLFSSNKIYVSFDQAYASETYQDKVRKRIILVLIANKWKIFSESTLEVY